MTIAAQLAGARVFDLEQPRFAGMPMHPAHKPGYLTDLIVEDGRCTGVIAIPTGRQSSARDRDRRAC